MDLRIHAYAIRGRTGAFPTENGVTFTTWSVAWIETKYGRDEDYGNGPTGTVVVWKFQSLSFWPASRGINHGLRISSLNNITEVQVIKGVTATSGTRRGISLDCCALMASLMMSHVSTSTS
ncbi:hypothetical protein M378DRAFT_160046 [Amanita muscaria Koide BX008]|uniref:Uncharacterized protein n=1 Tax=Amanita muscaria (strain Koide BX008) TaxID=946122 RepID=A0A0C2XE24_AMAMK|nr:hypothetical protein M378DRAFT_160046 [Amanita muscaria Koide BX008]